MIRNYTIVCPSCNGLGRIANPQTGYTEIIRTEIICPACNGTKTVMVSETGASNESYS